MRVSPCILAVTVVALFFADCSQNSVGPLSNGVLTIQAVAATPTVVPAGASSVVTCRVAGAGSGKLTYDWTVSGTYGYIYPMDSVCVFTSPGCHFGMAKVSVTVSDASGASVTGSVDINPAP